MEIWDIEDLTNANYKGTIVEYSLLDSSYDLGEFFPIDSEQCPSR